jgi:hypothetical protein
MQKAATLAQGRTMSDGCIDYSGSFEFQVGQAVCGLSARKLSFPAIRKITVRMVDNRR